MTSNSEKFSIDVEGETTGKTWKGVFGTKLRLSHKDELRQDEIRRELLGKNPMGVSVRANNIAEVFSFVLIHLTQVPQWWEMNGNGLDLEDDNVVRALYEKILDLKVAAQEKLKAEAEAARTALAGVESK
jgi:hypothetical protein